MTRAISRLLRIMLAVAAGAACLLLNDNGALNQSGSLLSEAHARIGRPLTPLSYAGVARRTTRRAVGAGAYYGAHVYPAPVYGAPGSVYGAPGCYQAVNAYGQLYWRCP